MILDAVLQSELYQNHFCIGVDHARVQGSGPSQFRKNCIARVHNVLDTRKNMKNIIKSVEKGKVGERGEGWKDYAVLTISLKSTGPGASLTLGQIDASAVCTFSC